MGMFDSVIAKCPHCGAEVEFQSKAGECKLKRYNTNSVPPDVAQDISDSTKTCSCGEYVTIKLSAPIARVQMVVSGDSDPEPNWD